MYEKLCSWENLHLAYQRASRGKRGHPDVASFEYHLESNLFALQEELLDFTYQPGPYHNFWVHDPKHRLISAAPFRDRVVHHALCNLIEPLFERSFIADSYANRVGKGTHRALARTQEFTRRYGYVLQCDLQQYFPSIDHAILRDILGRKIDDPGTLWLIERILKCGADIHTEEYQMVYFPADDPGKGGEGLFAALRQHGLPIGNLTSQFWANVYLNSFDHFVKRQLRCRAYLRYVDDVLLFHDERGVLWEWKGQVEDRLAELRLKIHPGAHPRPVSEGIPFLGFVVYPDKCRLKRRKGIAYRRRLWRLVRAWQEGRIPLSQVNASVRGWVNHARYGNTVGLRKAVLSIPLGAPPA